MNARPHLGHAYSTIVCDAIARRKRALGIETWFLTGTDEHGQKIERSAKLAGRTPQDFATAIAAEFRGLWDRLGLTYDDFIRTTEERHKRGVQKLFATLRDRGFIYKGSYTGQYCVSDEAWVDVPPGAPCPDCGRITETVSEENYFFKLSAFERKLLEFYEANPGFMQPESTRREVVSFVRSGLKDLSVSRTSFYLGHSRSRRRKARGLRLARRAGQLHHRSWLRLRRSGRPGALRQILACRHASHRQRDQPLPLRLLAGVPDGRRNPGAPLGQGQRLAALRPGQDVQVARQHRPRRNRAAKCWAPMHCATSCFAKFPSARTATSASTHWSSATTATSPTATATSSAAWSTWCTSTSPEWCRSAGPETAREICSARIAPYARSPNSAPTSMI